MSDITHEQLLQFVERNGIKGKRMLSILGKNQQFINAMNHPIGIEFLKVLIARMEDRRSTYDHMDVDASNAKFIEAKARYNECENLVFGFLDLIENHEKLLVEIKDGINNMKGRI